MASTSGGEDLDAAQEQAEFIPMAPHADAGRFAGLIRSAYRSRRFRAAALARPRASVYRRTLMLRFFSWCYRMFNETGSIPYEVFTSEVQLDQSAALIDTAGSFTGHAGIERALDELHDAFAQIRFEPLALAELESERILLLVRFLASGRGSGIEIDRTVGHLFSLRDGSVTRWEVYWEEAEALDVAGLAP